MLGNQYRYSFECTFNHCVASKCTLFAVTKREGVQHNGCKCTYTWATIIQILLIARSKYFQRLNVQQVKQMAAYN